MLYPVNRLEACNYRKFLRTLHPLLYGKYFQNWRFGYYNLPVTGFRNDL